MKKFLIAIILTLSLLISPAYAEFFSDIIVTSPNGIWTDTRAYSTLNAAITAVGTNERTIVIPSPQIVTSLTIPSTVTLKFERDGSITNSGQLTINTKNIIAPSRQIFTGTGDIDFVAGSVVRSSWFSDIVEAFDVTNDDQLTLIISKSTITSSCAVGDDVILKWEAPGNELLISSGVVVLSNIKNIEAGNYQLFAGAGDFDFLDGTELYLNWFVCLRSVLNWVEAEEVTIIVNEDSIVSYTNTVDINESIEVVKGGRLNIGAGITLTINGPFEAGLYQVFSGDGLVSFGKETVREVYASWFNSIQKAIDSLPDSQYATHIISHGGGVVYFNGEYTITEPIELRSNVALVGNGRSSRINITGNINCIEFTKYAGETVTNAVVLEGFSIVGDSASTQIGIYHGAIDPLDTVIIKIDNVLIRGCATGGILLENSIGSNITKNTTVHGCGYGIKLSATVGNESNANVISAWVNNNTGVGIQLEPGGGTTKGNNIVNAISEHNAGNIRILGGYSNVISNTYTEGCTVGYSIIIDDDPVTGLNSRGTIIENIHSQEQYFIQLIGAGDTVISNVRSNHASGQIDISVEATDTIIYDNKGVNVLSDASAAATPTIIHKVENGGPVILGNIRQGTYSIKRVISKASIADNIATSVFSITTTDETGNADGGGYAVFINALIGHNTYDPNNGACASKAISAQFSRAMLGTGTGVNSTVNLSVDGGTAAPTALTRDIASATVSVVETSEYINSVQFTIDLDGASVGSAEVVCEIAVIYYGFTTAPIITGL